MHQRIKPLDKGRLAIILQILEIGGLCFATFMKIQNSTDICPSYFTGSEKGAYFGNCALLLIKRFYQSQLRPLKSRCLSLIA